jgi:hypothetical protein
MKNYQEKYHSNSFIYHLNTFKMIKSFTLHLKRLSLMAVTGLTIFLCGTSMNAQNSVNFSGTWAFNESKSKMGDSPFRMNATTLVVKHDGNTLTADRTQAGFDGGEMKTTQKLTLDGKVCENTGMMDSKTKSIVTWSADKKSITIATTMVMNMGGDGMEMKTSETWNLGDDNKTLLIESVFAAPDGEMKTSLVYDKK